MKKNDAFSYDVSEGEVIVITVTPKRFRDSLFSVRAERDGKVFPRRPGTQNAPVFQFTVTKPVEDIHTVIFEFSFIEGSPDDAFYDVDIEGENDVGCPCGFTIDKSTENKEPAIEFFVAQ
ncbi:MAG: hypothetical protein QOG00_3241 [Pyrinomonadaceae bacterium]|nr:hypothetical protein [Pyrinomonadaceae bacterium]MDX6272034.1 hypothetical protein [Acidobacteriota bacterium]